MAIAFQNIEDYKKLFKLHYNGLVNFIYARYIQDWDQARDVVQTTFMKIWNNRDRIDITMSEKSYLYQAAKNTALDHIRKYKSQSEVSLEDASYTVSHIEEQVAQDADTFYMRTKITQALHVLKPKTRKIFELHKLEGLTYEEIASYLDISKRTVESNMARALILLRTELMKTLKNEE